MTVWTILGRVRLRRFPFRKCWDAYFMIISPLALLLITFSTILLLRPQNLVPEPPSRPIVSNLTAALPLDVRRTPNVSRDCESCSPVGMHTVDPYHNWEVFRLDYEEMLKKLRIFVYPDAFRGNESSPTATIFLPHSDPLNPKIGNYYSEHAFKLALLQSSLVTQRPEEAHFFFMPFSINIMRNHPLVHSESSISSFVADYVVRISSEFEFWNASGGADHFFVCCHSVGREATSKHHDLHNNAVQITCSSSYFQRLYTPHKDIALPQVWPRPDQQASSPPNQRTELIFFAGRVQNSGARQEILSLWGNDSSLSIFAGHSSMPYEEGFRRSRYCLHIKGYEVNTARVVDAIHCGCVPVLISNYYDLPFANILDWSKFSITINEQDIPLLKDIITSVSEHTYLNLFKNLGLVRKHFSWSGVPGSYDAFHMTAYQLWLRRGLSRLSV